MSGEVGFDITRLDTFATAVGNASPTLGSLVSDVATLRSQARPLLDDLMPSEQLCRPDDLATVGTGLLDLKAEIKRRIGILAAAKLAHQLGLPVDESAAFAATIADRAKVDGALREIRELFGKDTGSNGNRDDLDHLQVVLAGLGPEELDAVVDGLSDEDLSRLGHLVSDTSDSGWKWWDHNGLERWERLDFYGNFLSQVSPSRIERLAGAWPQIQPGFDSTDSFLDGANPQTGENATGMHWGTPDGPLFPTGADGRPDVDGTKAAQGTFGDCWFVASTLATQAADPGFAADHLRANANGTVSVKMYDGDGHAHWITVTGDVPVNSSGEPIGMHSDDGATWPAYYEKAFALAYQDDDGGAPDDHEGDDAYDRTEQGSYGALEWDFPDHAAPYITGHGADGLGHDFDDARDAFRDGHPVLISTPGEDDTPDPPGDWDGYVNRHVYYVVAASGDTITVANPWGPSSGQITMNSDQFDTYFGDATAMDRAQ